MKCMNSRMRGRGDFGCSRFSFATDESSSCDIGDPGSRNHLPSVRRRTIAVLAGAALVVTLAAVVPQASAADKDRQKVTGTVVKAADGAPVAGVTVYLITRTLIVPRPSVQTQIGRASCRERV